MGENVVQINGGICECKKSYICEKDYAWNPATFNCENRKYLASIMADSAITCDVFKELCDEEGNIKGALMQI